MAKRQSPKWKSYPKYKDSGVEWLGEVPGDWDVKRMRFVCRINPNKADLAHLPNSTIVSFLPMEMIGEEGQINLEETRSLEQVRQGFTHFEDDDIIVAKITPCFENGKGALCKGLLGGIGFGTTELQVLRPNENVDSAFIFHITKSRPFRCLGIASMRGSAGQKRITDDFIKDFLIGLPQSDEQRVIAAFLDRETAKIDSLIAKKEQLIELLQEKRAAIISNAVTKGLDPNVPMKDSGVDWVRKIPENWEVKQLKWLANLCAGYGITSESIEEFGEYPVFGGNGIRGFTSSYTHEGDFPLIGRQGALCGCVNFAHGKFWASEHAVVATARPGVNPYWLAYLLRTMSLNAYSQSAAQPGLAVETISAIRTCMPPTTAEQSAIAVCLDLKTAKFNALINKIQDSIGKLSEYRSALISAVVTGKIDVRQEAA